MLSPQSATAGILAGVSDILAQRIADPRRPLNWRRTAAWALFGALYNGPSMHYWQEMIEHAFKGAKGSHIVALKVRA